MWCVVLSILLCVQNAWSSLWPRGVVHFAINTKDYDVNSQDIILSTLEDMERETCVKFFNIPSDFNATEQRILYITNPEKRKDCPPHDYNFKQSVVDMPIGYKCLNKKNIARIVVDMLRASIEDSAQTISSFDLVRKFQEELEDPSRPFLMNPTERNYINAHYYSECRSVSARPALASRRSGSIAMSSENQEYYKDKLWPLGIVMYAVDPELVKSAPYERLKSAMTAIELASCVLFQEVCPGDQLRPRNLLTFLRDGAEAPHFGFTEGNQSISLLAMVEGAPGHSAHTLALLLRALGVHMVSNRPDRDNHVNIHWSNVAKGKEHYLEQYPPAAWIRDARLPYEFESASHAPANYVCRDCSRGQMTVEPAHDNLWVRALSMGHRQELSAGDRALLDVLYAAPCRDRHTHQ